MMVVKNNRTLYFFLILIVIACGITSRKLDGIPTFFGDTLYALMIYYAMRMLFSNLSLKKTAILALFSCFCIEFLQLYKAEWLLVIRRSTLGHYALGHDFLWSDLGFYFIGVAIAFALDFNLCKN
jgi:Protein of unknown function (DUF2809)